MREIDPIFQTQRPMPNSGDARQRVRIGVASERRSSEQIEGSVVGAQHPGEVVGAVA